MSVDWHSYLSPSGGPSWPPSLLDRARSGSHTAYRWLARAVAGKVTTVVDLSRGTDGVQVALARPGRTIVHAEVQAVGTPHLDFADGTVGAITSATGIGGPLSTRYFAEIARVLRPGGAFAFLVPTVRPVRLEDLLLMTQVGLRLGSLPVFPGMSEFAGFVPYLGETGLRTMEDGRERYAVTIGGREDAEAVVDGLFLHPETPAHREVAIDYLTHRAKSSVIAFAVPVRRVVLLKATEGNTPAGMDVAPLETQREET